MEEGCQLLNLCSHLPSLTPQTWEPWPEAALGNGRAEAEEGSEGLDPLTDPWDGLTCPQEEHETVNLSHHWES